MESNPVLSKMFIRSREQAQNGIWGGEKKESALVVIPPWRPHPKGPTDPLGVVPRGGRSRPSMAFAAPVHPCTME